MDKDGSASTAVLVVGDVNPDLILRGDVIPRFGQAEQILTEATMTIGGSGAITAHGLARLGRSVSLAAAVGDDQFGARMRTDLAQAGVDVDAVTVHAKESTGLSVVLSTEHDRAILTLPGAIAALSAADAHTALDRARTAGGCHLHVASPFLLRELLPELPELLRSARSAGLTTSLDPNDAPQGEWHLLDKIWPHLDLLLPNAREAVALGGGDDPVQAARVLAGYGPLVVVKDGGTGAFACRSTGEVVSERTTPVDTVVDTTGAGDTFDAAFIDSWLSGSDLRQCLRRAAQAGALNVLATGGTAGQPRPHQLDHEGRNNDEH